MSKKVFTMDHNSVLKDLPIETTNKIEEASTVLLWNDVLPIERGIIQLAKSMGKKTIVYQHGRKGTSKYYPPFNEKIQADKLLVWGDFDRVSLIKAGQDEKRIEVVGSTIWRHLKEKKKHEGINIVFSPEHWDRPVQENEKIRKELESFKKVKGINIITKTIDSPSHSGIDWQNEVNTNRNDSNHLSKCIEVLQTADLVIGVSESTFELLAQAMDIPVIIVDHWEPKAFGGDMRYLTYRRVVSNASKKSTVEDLKKTIADQLANPEELQEERKKVIIDEGGINLDTIKLIKKHLC